MRKSREPLDRSDVISIISLLVALFGTLFSGIFAMLAQQSAEEANRIARDANTPSVSASAEWQIVNIELQLCQSRQLDGTYNLINGWAVMQDVLISNIGGRSVSLTSIRLAGLGASYESAAKSKRFVVSGRGENTQPNGVQLPLEIAAGASRLLKVSSRFYIKGDYNELERAEVVQAIQEASQQLYDLTWTFEFNNGATTSVEAQALVRYKIETQIEIPRCDELQFKLREDN